MTNARSSLPVLLTIALTLACDSGTKDAKPSPAAAAKPGDAKAGDSANKDAPPMAEGPANPHANPHANMPPMMGAPPKPAGPPRDITPSGTTTAETLLELSFAVPEEWEKGTPSNRMRVAQWVLPGPGGDAELVVFRFPGGGSVQANIDRWKGQFTPPEGKTIDDVSTTTESKANGLSISLVDVSGAYSGGMAGAAAAQSDSRMLAAIIEGSGDPFFFKAVGPKATMDLWSDPFSTMVTTFASGDGAAADGAAAGDAKAGDAGSAEAPEPDGAAAGDAKAGDAKAGG